MQEAMWNHMQNDGIMLLFLILLLSRVVCNWTYSRQTMKNVKEEDKDLY